jgi:prepilin-type N-terminal cleavage/methylation domain-containing protein
LVLNGIRQRSAEAGMSLIEVLVTTAVLAIVLIGVANAFGSSLATVDRARGITKASRFLEEVLDSIAVQPRPVLPLLNGNVLYSSETAERSRYRIEITVANATVLLTQVRVVLFDQRTGVELARVVSYRSER